MVGLKHLHRQLLKHRRHLPLQGDGEEQGQRPVRVLGQAPQGVHEGARRKAVAHGHGKQRAGAGLGRRALAEAVVQPAHDVVGHVVHAVADEDHAGVVGRRLGDGVSEHAESGGDVGAPLHRGHVLHPMAEHGRVAEGDELEARREPLAGLPLGELAVHVGYEGIHGAGLVVDDVDDVLQPRVRLHADEGRGGVRGGTGRLVMGPILLLARSRAVLNVSANAAMVRPHEAAYGARRRRHWEGRGGGGKWRWDC